MGVEEDRGLPHQASHLVQPALGVRLDAGHVAVPQADVAPGVASEGPAGAAELFDNGLDGLPLLLAVGLLGVVPLLGVRLGAVAQDALVARQAQAALGPEGGEIRVLLHKLVQDGDGVQVPADYLVPLRVQAVGGDFQVLPDDELMGKAVFQHVGVVIRIVVAEDQGLLSLGEVEGIPDHMGAVLPFLLAPDAVDIHQDVALVIDALEDFIILVHGDHEVVQAVGLVIPVEGQFRVGNDGMEKQVLYNAGPGEVTLLLLGGVLDFIGLLDGGGGRLRLLNFRFRRGRLLCRRRGGSTGGQEEEAQSEDA